MFKRKIEKVLYDNYKDKESKIIMIDGARQIGKSLIIRVSTSSYFKNYVEINLKSDFRKW